MKTLAVVGIPQLRTTGCRTYCKPQAQAEDAQAPFLMRRFVFTTLKTSYRQAHHSLHSASIETSCPQRLCENLAPATKT